MGVTTDRTGGIDESVQREVPSTFTALYVEAYEPMVRLGHLLTGSNEVGEEITQDAFARMCRRFDEVDNPAAYLRVAVVNGCRSWHRRQGLERRWLHPAAAEPEVGATTRGELADVLAALPFRQRAALVLRFYEDRTIDEIATTLGCRPGTAKSHVSRGLDQIRKVIQP